MTCDFGDASLVHTETWFLNGGNFEEVESAGIEKEKGENSERVDSGMNDGEALKSPKLGTVVTVRNEIGDEGNGRGYGGEGKENAEKTFTEMSCGERANRGEPGMKRSEGKCVKNDVKVSRVDRGKIGKQRSGIGKGVTEGEKEGECNCSCC